MSNYQRTMEDLDRKMRDNPSTPEQERYYEFTLRCKGYEFVSKVNGKIFTKLQLYAKFIKKDINQLNLLEEDVHLEFKKRIKSGWEERIMPSGIKEARPKK